MKNIKTGSEVFASDYLNIIEGKRIGIIANHTSIIRNNTFGEIHLVDYLHQQNGVPVKAIFSPEHGFRGDVPPGKHVDHSIDPVTGIQIFSLYGHTKKPTADMLKDIDILIYDIQDVGVRFYTFISTLYYTMEAAAENNIKYIVLDRPNMLSNEVIDGPVLEDSMHSFIGVVPIPITYGLTPGELARMINNERWLSSNLQVEIDSVPVHGYLRNMWYDETGLPWANPSPNLRSMNAIIVYPGLALLEGTNISEGRGTDHPFCFLGAPYIDGENLARFLNDQKVDGVYFEPIEFIPKMNNQMYAKPKLSGIHCKGIQVCIYNRNEIKPVELGIWIVWAIHTLYPDNFRYRERWFDRLVGTNKVREFLEAGKEPSEIFLDWKESLTAFRKASEKYHMYPLHN